MITVGDLIDRLDEFNADSFVALAVLVGGTAHECVVGEIVQKGEGVHVEVGEQVRELPGEVAAALGWRDA
ncbi:hypothetical protein [Jiangella alkaliphila]|uniref:Uncharacterized protein n=1 Tax=Jiangella alkaliphila TaxID=419479 RepID=A0A1H2LD11_9ACTN|nr:hypothetical protein [Jiangella alkaliphila]SDU78930.1 hypothetical protein SAMN04488563_5894 [Jiangella alkaliphila]